MLRRFLRLTALCALCALVALGAPAPAVLAQGQATLVADSLEILGGNRLVASGHVVVYYEGRRLTASRILYDAAADRLVIEGPITVDDGKGNILTAEAAELSADLTEGILTAARLVLADRLRIAAAEVERSDGGRLTTMRQVAASSCRICPGSPVPIWEIRARSVEHDAETRFLTFRAAQLRFWGVPVFYLPRLRLPDPTVERASGFLMPSLSSSSARGVGLRFPYFLTLGASRDLTLTPFLTTKGGRTLELRFRQALRQGGVTVTGAVTADQLEVDHLRGYLDIEGDYALPLGLDATFHAIAVSDPAYLSDYDISDEDRLDSRLTVTRVDRDAMIEARLIGLQYLREDESYGNQPALVGDLAYQRRFSDGLLGGSGGFTLESHGHYRPSAVTTDENGDGIADGRDLARVSFTGDWRRDWVWVNGMVLTTSAALFADAYAIDGDAVYAGNELRAGATLAADLRWPLARALPGGGHALIEPVVQLVAAPPADPAIPNEDSALVEFDEGNLFALGRFPGADAREAGLFLNLGANALIMDGRGRSLHLTMGRVIRASDEGQFAPASGLDGIASDWLLAGALSDGRGLDLAARFLLDDNLRPTKAELSLELVRARHSLSLGLTDLVADPAENRPDPLREVTLGATRALDPNWSLSGETRYDLFNAQATTAGLGLSFLNECIAVDLSVSRRFTSSTSVRPTTDLGLSVELLGFGGGKTGPARACR